MILAPGSGIICVDFVGIHYRGCPRAEAGKLCHNEFCDRISSAIATPLCSSSAGLNHSSSQSHLSVVTDQKAAQSDDCSTTSQPYRWISMDLVTDRGPCSCTSIELRYLPWRSPELNPAERVLATAQSDSWRSSFRHTKWAS